MMVKVDFKTLRKLDDIACTNIVTARNIYKLIKKNPSFKELAVDCWVCGDHYTNFFLKEKQFNWSNKDGSNLISDDSEFLRSEELNKLIVYTYRTICDNTNNDLDFTDSAEELLAIAESKLKEIIADDQD